MTYRYFRRPNGRYLYQVPADPGHPLNRARYRTEPGGSWIDSNLFSTEILAGFSDLIEVNPCDESF